MSDNQNPTRDQAIKAYVRQLMRAASIIQLPLVGPAMAMTLCFRAGVEFGRTGFELAESADELDAAKAEIEAERAEAEAK